MYFSYHLLLLQRYSVKSFAVHLYSVAKEIGIFYNFFMRFSRSFRFLSVSDARERICPLEPNKFLFAKLTKCEKFRSNFYPNIVLLGKNVNGLCPFFTVCKITAILKKCLTYSTMTILYLRPRRRRIPRLSKNLLSFFR